MNVLQRLWSRMVWQRALRAPEVEAAARAKRARDHLARKRERERSRLSRDRSRHANELQLRGLLRIGSPVAFFAAAETSAKDAASSVLSLLLPSLSFSFSSSFLPFASAAIAFALSLNIFRRLSSLKYGSSCSTIASNINFLSCASTQFTYADAYPNPLLNASNISLTSIVFPHDGGPCTCTFGANCIRAFVDAPPTAARRKSTCFFLAGQRERSDL